MKDKAAPKAKPNDRKKAMMAPAVSASCGRTFLQNKRNTIVIQIMKIKHVLMCLGSIPYLGPKHMQRLAR